MQTLICTACWQDQESSNWNSELIIGAKRENYQAERMKLVCVCEGRTQHTPRTTPPIALRYFKTCTKPRAPLHSWVQFCVHKSCFAVLHPSPACFPPAHTAALTAASFCSSDHQQQSSSPCTACSHLHLLTNFYEAKRQKMSKPFLPSLFPLPTVPLPRLSHGHIISC